MESQSPRIEDRKLCDDILRGASAVAELQERFRRKLELYLLGHCERSDGRSQERAVEIASQVLSDCFTKSPPLLEKWQGNDNLEAFLRTVALNRLKSWWVSRDSKTEVDSDSRSIAEAVSRNQRAVDWEELGVAKVALEAGVRVAGKECPEGLVFLRLKGLHGVDQRVLSTVWGHHEAQTSRRIKEAMTLIRSTAAGIGEQSGIELEYGVLQMALQGNPSILLGESSEPLDASDTELLRRLAEGGLNRNEREACVALMCRNPNALEFFAQLLNRSDASQAVFVRDPALEGAGARIAESARHTLMLLKPSEARSLVSPLMTELFGETLRTIAADGGTLWWLSPGDAVLEAVFNPLEPEIAGKRQPLVSGIISLVLATSETLCVEDANAHDRHSGAIDEALGKSTRSMIAVPFRIRDDTRGVLTAVRLGSKQAFGARETEILERETRNLAVHFDTLLVARILGEPG